MPVLSVPLRVSNGVDSFEMFFNQMSGFQRVDDFLNIVGLLFIGKFVLLTVWDVCVGLRAMVWSRLWKKNFEQRYGGKWAVVTGCTDGIGKAYSEELAKDGLSLVLISRSLDKLKSVASHIESTYGVETAIVVADFSTGASVYPAIAEQLQGKEVSVLVNNVGIMLSSPKYYEQLTDADIWGHVNVNMASVCCMTKLVLPAMLQKKSGAVVNIASIAGRGPMPLLGIYAASKVFVEYLSLSLESEYCSSGVTFQTVTPAYVSTNMVAFSKYLHTPNLFIPTAPQFAASAASTLGYTSYTTGYWTHGVMKWFVDKLPRTLFSLIMKYQQMFLRSTVKTSHTN